MLWPASVNDYVSNCTHDIAVDLMPGYRCPQSSQASTFVYVNLTAAAPLPCMHEPSLHVCEAVQRIPLLLTCTAFLHQRLVCMQDLMMVSTLQLHSWEEQFAVKVPFRKLCKVMASMPCNAWWTHLKANGWLPNSCSVSDLMLYDTETVWQQVYEAGFRSFTSFSGTSKPLLSVPAFIKQADEILGKASDSQKMRHLWQQYRAVLQTGLGLRTSGDMPVPG